MFYNNKYILILVKDKNNTMTDNNYQIAKVKGYTKKYKRKDGSINETNTNTISLGANSIFKDGDSVIIMNLLDYKENANNQEDKKEIDKLKSELNNYSKKFKELEKNYQEVFQEFQEIKETNKTLQKDLNNSYNRNETIHNALHKAQEDLRIKDKIITAYESYSLWDRIRKRNPKDNMEVLEIEKKN